MQRFLNGILNEAWKGVKVIHSAVLPALEPQYGELDAPLPRPMAAALHGMGIRKLYRHQAIALEKIRAGENIVAATPTASGKSLIYNLAVAEGLLADPEQRALYLFPIKALSRDQLEALTTFFGMVESAEPFTAAVYDGDTTPHFRAKIRQKLPHVLLSNPDMLHYALLPHHGKWEELWRQLRYVVIDEMHTYRGVFGSHVGQVLRRLQRICAHYGSDPRFIFLSATIANPESLARQLIDRPVTVVDEHGAPQAKRHLIFLEPDEPVSSLAARLTTRAAAGGIKTIVFTQSRRMTELVHMSVARMAPKLAKKISSYRAGFLASERRDIERKLASGELFAVISTSALEMGVDIGGLDLCILAGYPGTVMNTWQRGGRVGREGRESAIILLPQADALDQYIVHHPREFLDSRYETAIIDPCNSEILKAHLPCAASELPIKREEASAAPPPVRTAIEGLTDSGQLVQTADGEEWLASRFHPHRQVDIRGLGSSYTILAPGTEEGKWVPLGKSDGVRALKECHPGAMYLHRGETYHVEALDIIKREIRVRRSNAPYFTRVLTEKDTEILEILASKPAGNFLVRLGRIRVTERIVGYEQRKLFTMELLATNPLDSLPPGVFETVGLWIEIEPAIENRIRAAELHFMGGIHAVEHGAIGMFPLFALCDRNDIGGIAYPNHPQVEKSAIFIYDGHPGGIGLAARAYEVILPLLEKTKELIASCPCSEGCPACIHSPKCGAGNKPLDKAAALLVLRCLLGEVSMESEDDGQEGESSTPAPIIEEPEPPAPPSYRIGYFDIETQRLANEVGGWQNKHLMRVSVAVLYETPGDVFHVYREEDVPKLIRRLQELDLVVGFNVRSFDYAVLKAYTPFDFSKLPTFDMLDEVYRKLGFRLSLDHLAENTLGKRKTADGLQAVSWFREGKWDPLIEYCKADVAITRDLFLHALDKGYFLYSDKQGRKLRLPTPWSLETLVNGGETEH
ncbi:MAG: DEAD/DEAH box helicase [Syntrophobacteraceae bacterium]